MPLPRWLVSQAVQNELIVVGDTKESKLFTTRPPALSVSIVSRDVFLVTASTVTFQILDRISKVLAVDLRRNLKHAVQWRI